MMNWFKNRNEKISVTVNGVHPQTDNEFKFYEFVSKEPVFTLTEWYKETKRKNIPFKSEYENAIKQKIKTGKFYNPINFR
jgi:DNA polymerase-3 subunit epsilon